MNLCSEFYMWIIATQWGCSQLLLLAAQMLSNWMAPSPARLHLGCEGYVSQTVTLPRNPLCLSPADIHIHVTMLLWPGRGFGYFSDQLGFVLFQRLLKVSVRFYSSDLSDVDQNASRDFCTAVLIYLTSVQKYIREAACFHEYRNKAEFYIKKRDLYI